MNTKALLSIALGVFISCAMMIAPAKADVWNQQTKVTFSQPVEVPGRTLPAGTYWFVLANGVTDRNIVQIFSQDWSTLYATVLTVPNERLNPPDDTLLTLAERESNGTPSRVKWYYPGPAPEILFTVAKPQSNGTPAILTWFYPGQTIGHEFEYSKSEESELSQDKQETLLVNPHGSAVTNGL
jgi:hypothetical protein